MLVFRRRIASLAVVVVSLLVVSVAGSALAATPGATPVAPVVAADPVAASIDDHLAGELASAAPADRIELLVHGSTMGAVEEAIAANGLEVLARFDRIAVAWAAGTPTQIVGLSTSGGITHLEGNQPLEFQGTTSHRATRSVELQAGIGPCAGEETPVERDECVLDAEKKAEKERAKAEKKCEKYEAKAAKYEGRDDEKVAKYQGKADRYCDAAMAASDAVGATGFDGTGVSIAIIDGGVDGTHPMFTDPATGESRVVVNKKFFPLICPTFNSETVPETEELPCFGPASEDFDDPEGDAGIVVDVPGNDSDTLSAGGHGTHVASTAAGGWVTTTDGQTVHGAAPGSKVISLSAGISLSMAMATQAQYWVLEHHADPCGDGSCPPIRVVNNSYGPVGGGEFNASAASVKVQRVLAEEGVVMVWAAGNDGGDGTENLANPPGQDPTPGILMVANYNDHGDAGRDHDLNGSSSRSDANRQSTWSDISAPGTDITAACRAYLSICASGEPDPDYGTISGTSMAAPHVAGIVAQLLEAKPDATPAEIENVIEDTAHQFTFGGAYYPDPRNPDHSSSYDKGHGLIDAVEAARMLLGLRDGDGRGPVPACASDETLIVDAVGDVDSSDVDLDMVELDEDGEGLVLTIHAADLTGGYPEGSTGYRFQVAFVVGEGADARTYYLTGDRSQLSRSLSSGVETDAVSFSLDRLVNNLYTGIADLEGSFDFDTDTITVHLTQADVDVANADTTMANEPKIPALDSGLRLRGFVATSMSKVDTTVVSTLSTEDTAAGRCTYTLGAGTTDPVAPSEEVTDPGGDGGEGGDGGTTVSIDGEATLHVGDDASFEGAAPTTQSSYTCPAGPGDPNCRTYLLHVDEGTLNVWIDASVFDDFDLKLFDADGNLVESSGGVQTLPAGLEGFAAPVSAGDYYIVVVPYDAVQDTSTFTLSIQLD